MEISAKLENLLTAPRLPQRVVFIVSCHIIGWMRRANISFDKNSWGDPMVVMFYVTLSLCMSIQVIMGTMRRRIPKRLVSLERVSGGRM